MRNLLMIAAGTMLLAGPALAQAMNPAQPAQPSPAMPATAPAPGDASTQPPPTAAPAPTPETPDTTAAPTAAAPVEPAPTVGTTPAVPPADASQTSAGTRMYSSSSGAQVVANSPIPDTPAERRKYPPLSRAGKRTAANGH